MKKKNESSGHPGPCWGAGLRQFSKFTVCVPSHFSHFQLFATLWTVAHRDPLSMGFSRQEYWSGLPFPSPRDLPDPGFESMSPALQADSLTSEPTQKLERIKLSFFPSEMPWGQWWSRKQQFLRWNPGRTLPLFTWVRATSWACGGPEKVASLCPSTHPPFPVPFWGVILWFNLPGFLWRYESKRWKCPLCCLDLEGASASLGGTRMFP